MSVYAEFLESKRTLAPATGKEPGRIHPALFPFQRDLVRWSVRKGRCAIFADTGLGKTLMQAEWARQIGEPTLILAPLSVAPQTVAIARDLLGIEVQYARRQEDVVARIVVTNYEMLDSFDPAAFGAVVLDECFPAGTLVDTPFGPKHIEDFKIGDMVYSGAGPDVVWNIHRREVPYAVVVRFADREVICSPNHPWFTARGWVCAQDLEPGDSLVAAAEAMRMVRDDVPQEERSATKRVAFLRAVLLSEMENESAGERRETPYAGDRGEERGREECLASVWSSGCAEGNGAHSRPQSNGRSGGATESLSPIEGDRPSAFRAWGQWSGADFSAVDAAGHSWRAVAGGAVCVTGPAETGLSNALQARLGQRRAESRYRTGWGLAPLSQIAGREEGRRPGFTRVDSLEVLEPGDTRLDRFRDADGKLYFYDLGIVRHPSFSVAGHLVHNSSILKAIDGKTRQRLTEAFAQTPYRLCCTATPAPNDITEIANHAEFLGIATRANMLATYFVHDDEGWRLKGHAEEPFYRWLASWGMFIRRPSDIGHSDDGYDLPPLRIAPEFVDAGFVPSGQMFWLGLKGIGDRTAVRKGTVEARVARTAELVNADADQWIVWCGLNEEGRRLHALIPGSVLVEGGRSPEEKAAAIESFQRGEQRVLVTKGRISGFGLNLQNAHKMAFVGMSDSWELYYQCIRRCYRFGQRMPVEAHIVLSDAEQDIYENVMRKEAEAKAMAEKLIANVREFERQEISAPGAAADGYEKAEASGDGWRLLLGDAAERLAEVRDESVGLSVFSPPFMSLYTYSPSERDLGNSTSPEQFFAHFRFAVDHLLRVTMPGRNCCVHVAQVPSTLANDGLIGLKDFRGQTITAFEARGWIYHGEVCIDKDPQAQAIRTHAKGLLFAQLRRDASWLRPALADYILVFRKPGDNPVPVHPDISNDEWIDWARPVWYGIRESDTLNVAPAREERDERHICPLQLGTIERVVRLWSNRGEMVLSPFAGIGSEGYVALKHDREFVGIELKRSYFDVACRNLASVRRTRPLSLLDAAGGGADA